jgi:UDP-N-acetylmuramoyl-L-alanyl-D-glutamate--2,6-diaminopimelate ligase
MTVLELIQGLEVRACTGPVATTSVTGVQCDSRLIRPGDLFVAVHGAYAHGLRFVTDACARGASAVVATLPSARQDLPWVELVGGDAEAQVALAHLACAVQGHPSRRLQVYAVTGTNGKTTTVGLLRDMLEADGRPSGLISTVTVAYPGHSHEADCTTPGICALQRCLRDMADAGCTAVAMEASSHALAQGRTDGTRFHAVAFTNLTQDHLDYHHDIPSYFAAKRRLFTCAAAARPGASAVINTDDAYGAQLAQEAAAAGLTVVPYGLLGGQPLRAEAVSGTADGTAFVLCTAAGRAPITSGLSGRYNVMNMLCAAGLALAGGVPLAVVARALCEARPRWGRLERVPTPLPCRIFVDYAHTADALAHVLATLREVTPGQLSVVFGCGGDRDRDKRPKMGLACALQADRLVITSDNPRSEDPAAIIRDIVAGLPPGTSHEVVPDRFEAIARALRSAGADDVVLIAGKGHEAVQIFADRTIPFDDRDVVREIGKRLAETGLRA